MIIGKVSVHIPFDIIESVFGDELFKFRVKDIDDLIPRQIKKILIPSRARFPSGTANGSVRF